MAKLPDLQPTTAELILKAYAKPDEHRMHLGASIIGKACARQTYLTFRWAETEINADPAEAGRKRRLFRSGDLQEPRLVEDLRRIGVEVQDRAPDGSQWRVKAVAGHFGGSMDGAGLGIPEAPKTWHVLEFKTSNQKNFDLMVNGTKAKRPGVQVQKPEHYAQMQCYMGLTGMDRALYLMVNKNTDAVYSERVRFDKAEFDRLMKRAESIIYATEPPEKISNDPSWWECGFCRFKQQCHGDQVPEVNCRTCAHSTPSKTGDGEWLCSNNHLASMPVLSEALQRTGCGEHRYIPIFLERTAKPVDYTDGGVVVYETKDGHIFGNGDGTNGTFSSHEIRAMGTKAALPQFNEIKLAYAGSKVVA